LTVRLYSIGEELYVEVTGEAEYFEAGLSISSKEDRQNVRGDGSRRHRLGLSKGWLRFRNSTEHGATLAMSFRSSQRAAGHADRDRTRQSDQKVTRGWPWLCLVAPPTQSRHGRCSMPSLPEFARRLR
jgi:hypothetical protein